MTDEPDEPQELDEGLTPEQDSRLRSALASARVSGPTPAHVAARLDVTLADLVAERAASDEPTGQSPRKPGRRGRWLLLAGAASVAAIVAFSVPALRPAGVDDVTSAGGSSDSAKSEPRGAQPGAPTKQPRSGSLDAETAGPVLLSTGSFRADVRRLLSDQPTSSLGSAPESSRAQSGDAATCDAGTPPPGVTQQRRVLLDGEPALLEVFRTRRDSRLIRAVSCDGTETLASTRIPAN